MIYHEPPENFNQQMQVVCCWIEHNDEILFLRRAANSPQPHLECLPGGKVNPGETLEQALQREIAEECGFELNNLSFAKTVYVRRGALDYILHMYKSKVSNKPIITLDLSENSEYKWLTMPQVEQLDQRGCLIADGMECIRLLRTD